MNGVSRFRRAEKGKRKQPGKKTEEWSRREKRCLGQLVFSGGVFVFLVVCKIAFPTRMEAIRQPVSNALQQNMNLTEVFSVVGNAFSSERSAGDTLGDLYRAVFRPEGKAVAVMGSAGDAVVPELEAMHTFAQGEGSCYDWLLPEGAAETEEPTETSAVSEEEAVAAVANLVYTQENLPDGVSMEQKVLGFSYCQPVSGTLSSGFGYREHPVDGENRFHYGVDLAADTGTAVSCFADGTVTVTGESNSYGKYLMVAHQGGYSTLYAHCSAVCVSSGAAVKEGQKIAEVGATGICTGPHLHFELYDGDTRLNPIYYLKL